MGWGTKKWYVPSTCLPAAAAAAEPSTEPSGAAANALPNCAAYAELSGSAVDPVTGRAVRLALGLFWGKSRVGRVVALKCYQKVAFRQNYEIVIWKECWRELNRSIILQ